MTPEKLLVGSFVLFKLILVSKNEIVALPNDSAVFVKFALFGISDLGPPVGYPLWLLAIKIIGLPQRIAIELLYLCSCCFLYGRVRGVLGKYFSIFLVFLLIFNPVSFHLFDNGLSDSLYLCLVVFGMAASVDLIQNIDKINIYRFIFIGVIFGFMGIVRNEAEIIFAWLAWLTIFAAWKVRALNVSRAFEIAFLARLCFAIGLVLSLNALPAALHWAVQGVWVKTLPTLPSHMKMLANLASISTAGEKTPRISVSKEARLKAYAASPSLSTLKDHIENSSNMYMVASQHDGGLPSGEIGNGWVWHVFNDAAINVLPNPRTIASLNNFWLKVNSELEDAFTSGKLDRRFVLHPFIAGGPFSIAGNLPLGLVTAYEKMFIFMPYQLDQYFSGDQFDALMFRRSTLVNGNVGNMGLRGWVVALEHGTAIKGVQVGIKSSGDEHTAWIDANVYRRDDVSRGLSLQLAKNVEVLGFEVVNVKTAQKTFQLRYLTNHGTVLDLDNAVDEVKTLNSPEVGSLLKAVDRFTFSGAQTRDDVLVKIQTAILNWNGWTLFKWASILAVFGAIVIMGLGHVLRKGNPSSEGFVLLIFVVGVVIQRLVFYGILDRFAWEIEPRYVAPVFALWIFAIILAMVSLTGFSKSLFPMSAVRRK